MNVEGRKTWITFDTLIFISICFFSTIIGIFILKRLSGLNKESKIHIEEKIQACLAL